MLSSGPVDVRGQGAVDELDGVVGGAALGQAPDSEGRRPGGLRSPRRRRGLGVAECLPGARGHLLGRRRLSLRNASFPALMG
eukprot:5636458-Alexandrium_andersonii.AAC.1